jgi:hypothetical protein
MKYIDLEETTQSPIWFKTVMDLGFKEEFVNDKCFFDEMGFEYSIVQLKLTKNIYLQWEKDTRFCTMYRHKNGEILSSLDIKDEDNLIQIVDFFRKNRSKNYTSAC